MDTLKSHRRRLLPFPQSRLCLSVLVLQRASQKPIQLAVILMCTCILSSRILADEIVLRNLDVLSDVIVEKVDADGIRLDDGRLISLAAVKNASLSKQTEFDQLLKTLGEPLFRIRIRLERKDHESLGDSLATLLPVYENRTSQSAALVQVANFWHHIEQGNNALAIQSHFRLFQLSQLNADNASFITSLTAPATSSDGLSPWLAPIDLDKKTIAENWASIITSYTSLPTPHPSGLDYYFFTIAQAGGGKVPSELLSAKSKLSTAEQRDLTAHNLLINLRSDKTPAQSDINAVLQAYLSEGSLNDLSPIRRATGLYFHGRLQLLSEEIPKSDGLLNLLRVHSEIGEAVPSISAAALSDTERFLRDKLPAKDAKTISKELLSRYPSSIFAKRFRMAEEK